MYQKDKSYSVEMYGRIRPENSDILNHLLAAQLREFDFLYNDKGGIIGSPKHEMERENFASIVGLSMVSRDSSNINETIGYGDYTDYYCATLGQQIRVETSYRSPNCDLS